MFCVSIFNYRKMKNIPKENRVEVLKNLATEATPTEVEITTFDFEIIKGIVTQFKIGEYNEDLVLVEDNVTTSEVEIDFIRDLIIYDK